MVDQAENEAVEESEVLEEQEAEDQETDQETDSSEEDIEGFEVVDSDEDETPSSQRVPLSTFLNKKKKWKEKVEQKEADAEALRQENELLRLQLEQQSQPQEPDEFPQPENYSTPEEHTQALRQYIDSQTKKTAQSLLQEREQSRQQTQLESKREQINDEALGAYYERADKLRAPDFEAAEDAFLQSFGRDAGLNIIRAFDNSEAVVYALGKNPAKAQKFVEGLKNDPVSGLVSLTKYANNLTIQPRRKNIPEPDEPERGEAGAVTNMQKKLDTLRKRYREGKAPMKEVLAFKREAKAKGIALD